MKVPDTRIWLGFWSLLALPALGAEELRLETRGVGDTVELRLQSTVPAVAPVEARVQRTRDFQSWENVGLKYKLPAGGAIFGTTVGTDSETLGFFRLITRPTEFTSGEGADVLGYGGLFTDEIETLGNFSIADFSARYASPATYLPALTWDPTTAEFWTQFNDPAPTGKQVIHGITNRIPLPSWSLNPAELSAFRTNGFVVSPRLGTTNMADIYYDVFRRDLPVFITTDSILHAWHRSYDTILADLESETLQYQLNQMLRRISEKIPEAVAAYGSGWQAQSLKDADYYIAVPKGLYSYDSPFPEIVSYLDQEARVRETVSFIWAGIPKIVRLIDPSASEEWVDFSQFIPRGHYNSEKLRQYFRAMMWLGRIDLRVAGNTNYASPQQLGTAIVLLDLLKRSGQVEVWRAINQTLNVLVGPADSMDFDTLAGLLAEAGISGPSDLPSLESLEQLQRRIEEGTLGRQAIQGHSFWGSAGDDQIKLPRSFTFLGQRFVPDSWAFSQVVYDRIVEPGSEPERLVRRRLPYSLDVAFSVFGNDQIVPELVANMTRTDGVSFRDGFGYQRNLAAVRNVLDYRSDNAWENNVYNRWLLALRSLSEPTSGSEYPEAMRTRAWALKTVNTQLASWTQLRHDNILYAKQSETPPILCSYPAGFVEPRPAFFRYLSELTSLTDAQLSWLSTAEIMRDKIHPFLQRFGTNCLMLEGIAMAELAQRPLSPAETSFLQNTIEQIETYFGDRQYNGWYPLMYYRGAEGVLPHNWEGKPPDHDSVQSDFIVADVHTDGPSDPDGDPGAVLCEAVGRIHLLMIAVDNGPDRMVYAGPVLSHYEFQLPYGQRLTDQSWGAQVQAGTTPLPPPWTGSFLAPVED